MPVRLRISIMPTLFLLKRRCSTDVKLVPSRSPLLVPPFMPLNSVASCWRLMLHLGLVLDKPSLECVKQKQRARLLRWSWRRRVVLQTSWLRFLRGRRRPDASTRKLTAELNEFKTQPLIVTSGGLKLRTKFIAVETKIDKKLVDLSVARVACGVVGIHFRSIRQGFRFFHASRHNTVGGPFL